MSFLQAGTDIEIRGIQMYCPIAPDGIVRQHYLEHRHKEFYPNLMGFMSSGPTAAIAAQTASIPDLREAIGVFRKMNGAEGPANLLHCSDSEISGEREWYLWFPST